MNSSPASSQISRSSSAASARMREPDLLEPRGVELDAGLLGLAQHAHERQLDLAQQVLEPALAHLLALAAGELVHEHGARGLRVVRRRRPCRAPRTARRADSRGARDRAGRRRPRCRRRGSPGPRRAPSRRARSPAGRRRPRRARPGRRPRRRARAGRRRRRRSASPSSRGSSSPSGISGAAATSASSAPVSRARSRRRPCAPATVRAVSRLGPRDRGRLGRVERLLEPAQRVAQLELAEDRAQLRAVGLARRARPRGRGRPGRRAPSSRAAWRCARPRRARSGSACAWRRRSGRRWPAPPRASRSAAAARPRSCRRCPGRPGCCPTCRP